MTDWAKEYAERRETSLAWLNKSSDLKASAACLWHCIENEHTPLKAAIGYGGSFSFQGAVSPIYRMLCGLSLELLYKAIIVEQGNQPKTTHNLKDLAKDAGLQGSVEHDDLLDILTHSIEWNAKYPVPTEQKQYHLQNFSDLVGKRFLEEMPTTNCGLKLRKVVNPLKWNIFAESWDEGLSVYWQTRENSSR